LIGVKGSLQVAEEATGTCDGKGHQLELAKEVVPPPDGEMLLGAWDASKDVCQALEPGFG
jgi:hypothetical protein